MSACIYLQFIHRLLGYGTFDGGQHEKVYRAYWKGAIEHAVERWSGQTKIPATLDKNV